MAQVYAKYFVMIGPICSVSGQEISQWKNLYSCNVFSDWLRHASNRVKMGCGLTGVMSRIIIWIDAGDRFNMMTPYKYRNSHDKVIFTVGIPTMVRRSLYIELAHWCNDDCTSVKLESNSRLFLFNCSQICWFCNVNKHVDTLLCHQYFRYYSRHRQLLSVHS